MRFVANRVRLLEKRKRVLAAKGPGTWGKRSLSGQHQEAEVASGPQPEPSPIPLTLYQGLTKKLLKWGH